ncbi:hypothetical protein SDC9_108474 [bioreactor metagenome]|uniref:Uncharacterized protein n=1 Tax=bioreactor metagenome TaxID=1076179 RepID=A0A645BIP8_9ZZZZ
MYYTTAPPKLSRWNPGVPPPVSTAELLDIFPLDNYGYSSANNFRRTGRFYYGGGMVRMNETEKSYFL